MQGTDLSGTLSEADISAGFRAVLGIEPRVSDVQVVQLLGGTRGALAEYIWDHFLGEPESPSLDELQTALDVAIGEVSADPADSE